MPNESQKSYFPLTHYVPIFYKMIPNGHATFKLSECILVATLRLRLGGRVLGLFGSSRTAAVLVQRRWCTARRRVAMMMMMMLVVVKTAVVAVQLPIPLLPLDLLVLQRSIVATRRNGNSCRRLTATGGGMMVALMMVRRLAGAASFHGVVAARLLLIGIEAQAVFIVGMRCHLAGGTLKDSDTLETLWVMNNTLLNFRRKFFFAVDLFFTIFSTFWSLCLFCDGTLWFLFLLLSVGWTWSWSCRI